MGEYTPQSRSEEILYDTIHSLEYTERPQSRIEELLLELKAVIEAGSGTSNYEELEHLPKINSVELKGDKSLADLGAASEEAVAAKASQSDIAPTFSDATAYTVGDVVYYDGSLYRFTADHAAGEWDSADVESVTVDDLVDGLKPVDSVTDGDMRPVTSNSVYDYLNDSVSVTKQSSDTSRGDMVKRLFPLIDFTRINPNTVMVIDGTIYRVSTYTGWSAGFERVHLAYESSPKVYMYYQNITQNGGYIFAATLTLSSNSWSYELDSTIPNSITLYYR